MSDAPLMDPETGEIDESRVLSIVEAEISDAIGYLDDEEDTARRRNVEAYLGKPYGNEEDGWSQYVDRTVYEAVESLMPYLMKVFHGNDQAVTFAAVPGGDPGEQAFRIKEAQDATVYAGHVYNVDNAGYRVTQDVIKDALVQRVGWWKVYVEEIEREETKRFSGLGQDQVMALGAQQQQDVKVEVVSENETPQGLVFDVKVSRQWKEKRITVEAVPSDQMVYARRAKNIDDLPFIGHLDIVTRSDLVAEGHDKELVDAIPVTVSGQGDRRRGRYDRTTNSQLVSRQDRAMEEVEVAEIFIRLDLDGDGIAEWCKLVIGGIGEGAAGGKILDYERCDDHPFVPLTPITLPHQIEGLSVADVVQDLQRLRSEVVRQMVDGLFLTNHPRWQGLEGKYDAEQALDNRPGDIIDVKTHEALQRMDSRWEGAQALPFLELIDRVAEARSGISPHGTVQAASSMTRHAEGTVDNIMQASMARQELMARNMAENGFTMLYRKLLKLIVNHQDKARQIRLNGEFVEMDPTKWSAEMDVEVNAGVGVGSNQIRGQILMQVGQAMERLMQSGFRGIGEEQIYNWFKDVLKAADMPAIDPYVMDVTQMEPPKPPPPPDPTQDIVYVVEKMKQDAALERERIKDQRERDEADQDLVIEAEKLNAAETIAKAKELQKANDGDTPRPTQPAPTPASGGEVAPPASPPAPAETFFKEPVQ